jgi:hypothetical protein
MSDLSSGLPNPTSRKQTPLLVHLVFHPASDGARALALVLHAALNDDAVLPGLRVPTVIVPEDGTCLPPVAYPLDEAERHVFVVLVDDDMVIESLVPSSRRSWADFVVSLQDACSAPGRRFIPVQLTESAWPLDERLDERSFVRALEAEKSGRDARLVRRLVVETCRFLQGEGRGERLPLTLFLSHVKADLASTPNVFHEIAQHLDATQPVRAWVDSAEIEGGSRFSDEIEKGVRDSALVVLATRNYSTRPWCRREMLLAKKHERPMIVVNALEGIELRSFPYGGNVPEIRWTTGGAARAVDLILKETLRHLHVGLVLAQQARLGDVIMCVPPEPATALGLGAGTHVLYPDPPLGDEEIEKLAPLHLQLETPMQRAAKTRSLARMPIVLSISEAGDAERHGLFPAHLDAALQVISLQLLARGATLRYGGHFGSEGYTFALFGMAASYAALSGLPPAERIVNDVGWPLPLKALPKDLRAKHQKVAVYERVPRPANVEDLEPGTFVEEPNYFDADSPARRYAWARGMTAMREAQTKKARARIVLGGKIAPTRTALPAGGFEEKWYSGRIPGVIEEACISLRDEQPLFVVGGFGGAAALVADLLEGHPRAEFNWDFQKAAPHAPDMRALYVSRGPAWVDYPEMTEFFRTRGVAGLSARNKLDAAENRELFSTRDVGRIVTLLVAGLGRLADAIGGYGAARGP